MTRRVPRWRPPKDASFDAVDYTVVTARKINEYRSTRTTLRWDDAALKAAYTWAGHVARFAKYAPQRLALKALLYRDRHYLETLERLYGHQCHHRRFNVWRWEQQFTVYQGANWKDLAVQGETWEDHTMTWLIRRKHPNYRDPPEYEGQ